jgi:hypothetical protein
MWELWCRIVEPKIHTPYETWAGNLFARYKVFGDSRFYMAKNKKTKYKIYNVKKFKYKPFGHLLGNLHILQ